MTTLALSIGSNIDAESNIRAALGALRLEFENIRNSTTYESQAVGFDGVHRAAMADEQGGGELSCHQGLRARPSAQKGHGQAHQGKAGEAGGGQQADGSVHGIPPLALKPRAILKKRNRSALTRSIPSWNGASQRRHQGDPCRSGTPGRRRSVGPAGLSRKPTAFQSATVDYPQRDESDIRKFSCLTSYLLLTLAFGLDTFSPRLHDDTYASR